MPDAMSILSVFSMPFLLGLFSGSRARAGTGWIAFLGLLPAIFLVVQSELHGSSCPGGECIAEGFALIFALLIAAVCLGYLVGGLLARVSQSAPEAAASARQIFRWLLVAAIFLMVVRIVIMHQQGVERRHAREAAEAANHSAP